MTLRQGSFFVGEGAGGGKVWRGFQRLLLNAGGKADWQDATFDLIARQGRVKIRFKYLKIGSRASGPGN